MKVNYTARRTSGNATEGYNARSGEGGGQQLMSAKQEEWIKSLCNMKRVHVPSLTGVTSAGASEIISKLQALPNWKEASEAQIKRILSRCADMALEVPDMVGLSMDKASKWIEFLNKKWETEFANRITAKQIDMIKKMCMCVDIDNTELLTIPAELWDKMNEAEMDLNIALAKQEGIEDAELVVNEVRKEIDTFAENFDLSTLNKSIASDFISKNQAVYYKWSASRASDGQRAMINTLITRMGNEEMSEELLMQFSKEDADAYIQQLQKEMGDTSLKGFGDEAQLLEVPEAWGGMGKEDRIPQSGCVYKREAWMQTICSLYATVGQEAEIEILEATEQETTLSAVIEFVQDEGVEDGIVIGCLSNIMNEEDAIAYLQDIKADQQAMQLVPDAQDIPW